MGILDLAVGAGKGLEQIAAEEALQQQQQLALRRQVEQERAARADEQFRQAQLQQQGETQRLMRQQQAWQAEQANLGRLRDDARATVAQMPAGTVFEPARAQSLIDLGAVGPERFDPQTIPNRGAVAEGVPPALAENESVLALRATPQEQAQAATLQRQQAADAAAQQRHAESLDLQQRRLALAEQAAARQGQAGQSQFTQEGLDLAATQYATTGQMPPLGMGAANARAAVINRAGELFPDLNIGQQAAQFAANRQSLTNAQKMYDAVTAFEKTASNNANVMMQIARKLTDTGSPLLNRPWRAVEQQVGGNRDLAAFAAARRVVVTEYARIVANPNLTGVLSDSARREMEDVLSGNATIPQMVQVMDVLRQDAENRRTALGEQIGAIQERIPVGGRETSTSPGEAPPAPRGFRVIGVR